MLPRSATMKVKLILTLSAFFFFSTTYAQKDKVSAKKIDGLADEHFRIGEYQSALKYYHSLDSLQPNVGKTNYYIGYCIFNMEQKTKSLPYFEKAKKANYPGKDLDLYLARSLHLNHQFDKAIAAYKSWVPDTITKQAIIEDEDLKGGEIEIKEIESEIPRYIAMCETGKKLVADSLTLVIENMGPVINSKYPDYVPVVSANETELIFTSRRPNTTGGKKDPKDNHYYEDLYISTKDSASSVWSAPVNMGTQVNTDLHDACVGLSPNGRQLFIYRAGFTRNETGDIYISNLDNKIWSSPKKVDKNINSDYWEPSASISTDEKTLFFSSNKPGGFGGTDIYVIKMLNDSTWGIAENMGVKVNSEHDEDAPYIHPDNKTLFYSSRGHNTMGGFDIFTSTLTQSTDTTSEWGAPVNAGYPINTADDDIYFIWSADGTKGYFSSWRDDSYGEKDLYVIQKPKVVEVAKVVETQTIILNNIFYDFDKATLRPESDPELEKVYAFLSQYPELKVELSGHTDARGSDKYNEKLSRKRAQAVVDFMTNKGISKNRIVAKGYGESKPIESNDTDEGRQVNRRTELKVIDSNFNIVNAYNNTNINYKNEFTGEITSSGRSIKNEPLINQATDATKGYDNSGSSYKKGDKYYMPNQEPKVKTVLKPKVHFTYKATNALTEFSTDRVKEIAEIMQAYPAVNVVLTAFADQSGTSFLTEALANKRIATAKQVLLGNGIDEKRIQTTVKAADTSNSTPGDPEADINNRRVEFVIAE